MLLSGELLFWWPCLSLSLGELVKESGGASVVPVAPGGLVQLLEFPLLMRRSGTGSLSKSPRE